MSRFSSLVSAVLVAALLHFAPASAEDARHPLAPAPGLLADRALGDPVHRA